MTIKHCRHVDRDTFKLWLTTNQIRPASIDDMWGTHHDRPAYAHPVTGQPYIAMPCSAAETWPSHAG